ncbi:MAG: RNA polymerase sporulation sigma factor SigE [Bacillota bacterium]|nr:RNA polymerase sporulation sigma factor SigE [Bacillota bacterium]
MNIVKFIKSILFKLHKYFAGESFYINGPETLPPPLRAEEESEYVNRLMQGDENAKKTLIEHNLRLVVYIARKFEGTGIGVEDLISIGSIGLIKAVSTFRADKNIKLATYASRCIENEILMFLRKNAYKKYEVSIDEPLNVDWDGNELLLSDILGTDEDTIVHSIEQEADSSMIKKAISKLSARERKIMEFRFGLVTGEEQTQKDVADMLGISQSYISRLEKKIIARLRREISKIS